MIDITFYASAIKISGHAFFDNHGRDIVCAGVSAIVFGGINYFKPEDVKVIKNQENNSIFLELLEVNIKNLTAINVIKTQLSVIASVYDKNIKIIDETNRIVTGK
ncbi:ribosomal-processing cysteine protease Prp [Mycoplasma bradburyae]|uniref:Ribosomal processing cysteine protease Prp n=1 Tax=Mycoplasma bradburyae TaxID=2963128 RepID=A0AAW6HPW0_9MOLU|nr:ribosomal-processing cysteine protease Prp [Mycoplasma bradburyae]MDC4182281.1 ribosomal-processing cysteine protease Prp [Mycoplasma bradburyae]MDC4182774.1 ribosomal-processing cysteine protease Prp [Mycoplasma bradburyae]MDC4183447.1 ribosomal-processing cysteine protease Prp [Mycoplasma bradburyae]MDC4184455.1 ribosomal-processing cysteine protease Prp [Mycoplasma bradburyae]UTS69787.1 ribosomal-processing cysteine protease Prp [Mycoplasma bradburyae]